jgi:hypothetical protein
MVAGAQDFAALIADRIPQIALKRGVRIDGIVLIESLAVIRP